ncbi:hypothetical protein LI328DRAFT_160748 [Trichoderma asperelloides]|nr:hypothetical protein LI328DRAFT_160748 [Trichoderma asperelloides]
MCLGGNSAPQIQMSSCGLEPLTGSSPQPLELQLVGMERPAGWLVSEPRWASQKAHLVAKPQHLKCSVAANHGARKGVQMELFLVGGRLGMQHASLRLANPCIALPSSPEQSAVRVESVRGQTLLAYRSPGQVTARG